MPALLPVYTTGSVWPQLQRRQAPNAAQDLGGHRPSEEEVAAPGGRISHGASPVVPPLL